MKPFDPLAPTKEQLAEALRRAAEFAACDACLAGRWHTEEDWANHPFRGHGIVDGRSSYAKEPM